MRAALVGHGLKAMEPQNKLLHTSLAGKAALPGRTSIAASTTCSHTMPSPLDDSMPCLVYSMTHHAGRKSFTRLKFSPEGSGIVYICVTCLLNDQAIYHVPRDQCSR